MCHTSYFLQKHTPRKFETNTATTSRFVFVLYLVKSINDFMVYSTASNMKKSSHKRPSQYVNKPFVLSKQSFEVSPSSVFSSHTGPQRQRDWSVALSMTFCSRPNHAHSNQAPLQISDVEYRRLMGDNSGHWLQYNEQSLRITVNVIHDSCLM